MKVIPKTERNTN